MNRKRFFLFLSLLWFPLPGHAMEDPFGKDGTQTIRCVEVAKSYNIPYYAHDYRHKCKVSVSNQGTYILIRNMDNGDRDTIRHPLFFQNHRREVIDKQEEKHLNSLWEKEKDRFADKQMERAEQRNRRRHNKEFTPVEQELLWMSRTIQRRLLGLE